MAKFNQAKEVEIQGADLFVPSFFALSISTGFHSLSNPYLYFSNGTPHNQFINLTIQFFLFILVPVTFIHGMVLLILGVAIPPESPRRGIYAIRFDRLAKATLAVTLLCLLTGAVIAIHTVCPDSVSVWWFEW